MAATELVLTEKLRKIKNLSRQRDDAKAKATEIWKRMQLLKTECTALMDENDIERLGFIDDDGKSHGAKVRIFYSCSMESEGLFMAWCEGAGEDVDALRTMNASKLKAFVKGIHLEGSAMPDGVKFSSYREVAIVAAPKRKGT